MALPHTVYLALGSNIGARLAHMSRALAELDASGAVKLEAVSFLYESDPMYVTDQDKFLNAAAKVSTSLAPSPLLELLKTVEDVVGRTKTIRNGPRVIDLDILAYDNAVVDVAAPPSGSTGKERWLKIPHPLLHTREFVLRPLSDLSPSLVLPSQKLSVVEMLEQLVPRNSSGARTGSTVHRVFPVSKTVLHPVNARTLLMSILNTTPDSFSDGGAHAELPDALAGAVAHAEEGSDILDIGGQSTRPGAVEVGEEMETQRVVPLVQAIRARGLATPISVDTFRAHVARESVAAGADMINDVRAGAEPGMLDAMADLDVPVVLMHSRGDSVNMSRMTDYGPEGVLAGVRKEMEVRVREAEQAGVKKWNIILDPGIGFAKTASQNLELLRGLKDLFTGSPLEGYPVLVGLSRKRFLGTLTGKEDAQERDWATAAGVTASVAGGAHVVRTHRVAEMTDVVKTADAIYPRGG